MNMPLKVEPPRGDRLHGAETAMGRLREWSRQRHWTPPNSFPASPFHKIKEMQENAGVHGEGIKWDIIEGVACKPDGGMADYCERHDKTVLASIRVRETITAIYSLPEELRVVVFAMYEVEQRERPKSDRAVAEKLGITRLDAIKRLERAYGWLGRELGLPPI